MRDKKQRKSLKALIPQPLLVLRGFRLFGNRLPAQRQPQALALHAQAWEKGSRSQKRSLWLPLPNLGEGWGEGFQCVPA